MKYHLRKRVIYKRKLNKKNKNLTSIQHTAFFPKALK